MLLPSLHLLVYTSFSTNIRGIFDDGDVWMHCSKCGGDHERRQAFRGESLRASTKITSTAAADWYCAALK